MKTNIPPKIYETFKLAIDRRCIIAAFIKLLFVFTSISLPAIFIHDYVLLIVVLFVAVIWFYIDYFNQPQKILIMEDRIVLVTYLGRINLFYDNIRSVQNALDSHTKLLRRNIPGFQFWGKRGWFRSKTLKNIFIYSLSSKITDHVLIKYAMDYYLISVRNSELFTEKLEEIKKIR